MGVQELVQQKIQGEPANVREEIIEQSSPVHGERQETPPSQQTEAPKEDDEIGSRFALLSRREKKLAEERRALEAQRKEMDSIMESVRKAKEDPDSYLQAAGLTLDEIIDRKLKGMTEPSTEDKIMTVEEKLKQLTAEIQRRDEEAKQRKIEDSIAGFKSQINRVIEANPDQYELIKSFNGVEEVFKTCEKYFEETDGETLDLEKACQLVEAELEKEVRKYTGIKKIKSLLGENLVETSDIQKMPRATDSGPSTLTGKMVSPAVPNQPTRKDGRLESREDSIARLSTWLEAEQAKLDRATRL